MHGSQTIMGRDFDTKSNDLFTYILYQVNGDILLMADLKKTKSFSNSLCFEKASMINIPYDPILHDLSLSPREMSAAEIVEYWLGNRKIFRISRYLYLVNDPQTCSTP